MTLHTPAVLAGPDRGHGDQPRRLRQADDTDETGPPATAAKADRTGDDSTLTVAAVTFTGAGHDFTAVHQDPAGQPRPTVGVARTSQGSTSDLVVTLDQAGGQRRVWLMQQMHDHTVGTAELSDVPDADRAVEKGDDRVTKTIDVTGVVR